MLLWKGPRPRPYTRGEDKPSKPKSRRSNRRWRRRSHRRRNHLRLPPPHHRRQLPPTHQHRTSERRPPQSAPVGPHSRSRHENENGTVPEHEYRPRGVRHVVRPLGAAAHSHPTEDGMLHPSQAAAVRLPPHGWRTPPPQSWRMSSSPRCRRKKWVAGPRGGRPRLAPPSSPARMMKILETEGRAEAVARLASPHHRTGGHHPG
jgi:hypothetical protein